MNGVGSDDALLAGEVAEEAVDRGLLILVGEVGLDDAADGFRGIGKGAGEGAPAGAGERGVECAGAGVDLAEGVAVLGE